MSSSLGFPVMATKICWVALKHAMTSAGLIVRGYTPRTEECRWWLVLLDVLAGDYFLIASTYDEKHHCHGKMYVNILCGRFLDLTRATID